MRFAAFALATAVFISAPDLEARELKIGLITPPPHVWTQAANRIAQRLPAETNGALTMKVFPAGQLGTEPDMFQQMSSGLLDMGLMTAGITSLRAPALNGWFSPYLFANVKAASKAAETPAAQQMLQQLDRAGLVGLGYTFAGMRHVLMRSGEVKGPDELKAKKVRIVPFPGMKTWWEAVGAVPTPIHLTETYQALQNGVLDGIDIDFDALVGSKFNQVATHLTLTNHMPFPAVFVVSKKIWNEMPAAQREVFTKIVKEELARGTAEQIAAEERHLASMRKEISVYDLKDGRSAFATANKAFQDAYGKDPLIAEFQKQAGALPTQ